MDIRRISGRQRIALFCGAAAVIALAWLVWPREKSSGRLTVATADVPVVMHTSGGRLEVATVTATEAFKLDAPPKSLFGVDLGQTVSNVQAKVVYRYHIEMAKEWPIKVHGTTAIVEAAEIKPTLPVAFDTATMEKQTKSGWARFDKHDNLDELERRLSPQLEERAYGYKGLALESARKSVGDFVRTWLMKQQLSQPGVAYQVQVVFPGEPSPSATTGRSNPTSP
jgi:hypothetical protein